MLTKDIFFHHKNSHLELGKMRITASICACVGFYMLWYVVVLAVTKWVFKQ